MEAGGHMDVRSISKFSNFAHRVNKFITNIYMYCFVRYFMLYSILFHRLGFYGCTALLSVGRGIPWRRRPGCGCRSSRRPPARPPPGVSGKAPTPQSWVCGLQSLRVPLTPPPAPAAALCWRRRGDLVHHLKTLGGVGSRKAPPRLGVWVFGARDQSPPNPEPPPPSNPHPHPSQPRACHSHGRIGGGGWMGQSHPSFA